MNMVVVGKDILELLGSSMYVDPLTIYREYVQNAADAIDAAVQDGLLDSREFGRIEISLDHIDRRIVIRDNGIGLTNAEFAGRMLAVGASQKRHSDARGFRGVGRLAGSGFCQELVFRSKTSSDNSVSEIRWDCRRLKTLLADPDFGGGLEDIVASIVTLNEIENGDYPDRFFEVELIKPRRIGTDILINENVIEDYVSQTCPVPFDPAFRFAADIHKIFSENGEAIDEFAIHINEADTPVYRPFENDIHYSETKMGKPQEIESIVINGVDGQLAAIGWILHHDYQGAIFERSRIKGLRARIGNIQIGENRLFAEEFPEERFNSWTIGEVHILDRRIVPNGRRDDFEHNPHLANLKNYLAPHAKHIARRCRVSSQVRNRVKAFEFGEQKVVEALDIIEQGAISKSLNTSLRKLVGTKLSEISKDAGSDLLDDPIKRELADRANELQDRASSLTDNTQADDPFEKLPKQKRAIYKEIIDLIYESSANRVAAKSLVDRIISKISHI